MSQFSKIAVFSENRDTRGTYISFANLHEATPSFQSKNKTSLQILLEQRFDIIFIEIMNPVMSEIEYVDQVFALAKGSPIVVISSYFFDTKDIVFGEKIAGFIIKPFDLEKIIEGVKSIAEKPVEEVKPAEVPVIKEAKVDNAVFESKKLSVLLEISRSMNSITDFDELLHHIISVAADALYSERATLFLVDRKKEQLWSRTGIGIEKQEIRIPLDKGIAGEVATSGKPQIINDPYSHPKFNKEIDIKTGFKTRNILCLPMKNFQGTVIGVFQILNKKEGVFVNEDLNFLSAMAASTGIAIENALLNDELKRQLVEVKQSYDDLYIAQNTILRESRFVTFSEILGYVGDVMRKSTAIDSGLRELKTNYAFDPQIKKTTENIQKAFSEMILKINTFFEDKKKEMNFRG